MTSSFNQMDDARGGVNGQRMMRKARPWGNVSCHFACDVKLPIRCPRKQSDHQVLQRNNANLQLDKFRIFQRWGVRLCFARL